MLKMKECIIVDKVQKFKKHPPHKTYNQNHRKSSSKLASCTGELVMDLKIFKAERSMKLC